MKRKLSLIFIIAITIGIFIIMWNNHQGEKKKKTQEELKVYKVTADDLHLELDLEQYKKTRQIQDVDLIPTEKTDSLLARWKDVSEIFPSLDFPKKDIEKEDWIKVHEVLINNRVVMEEISTEIANEADATADWQAVNNYIHFGEASPSYFKSYLESEGIENPG